MRRKPSSIQQAGLIVGAVTMGAVFSGCGGNGGGLDNPSAPQNGPIAFSSDRDGDTEIYKMNADGSQVRRLTNNSMGDGSPAFSPDGRRIAFTSNRDGNNEIYLMNADGTNQTRLTNNPAADGSPAFSPDGTKVAFTSTRDGNDEIYFMNADGTQQIRLTNNAASDAEPAFSPDGTKIAFFSDRSHSADIYVIQADGTKPHRVTMNAINMVSEHPVWTTDGQHLIYDLLTFPPGRTYRTVPKAHDLVSPVRLDPDDRQDIYAININGSSQTQLTTDPASDAFPALSPDGTQIVFRSERDGNFEIYRMNLDGSNQLRLTTNRAFDTTPSWGAKVS